MTWEDTLPKQADGGWYGLQISLNEKPKDWPAAIDRVPAEHRARAEAYLRGIAARIRDLRSGKSDAS